MKVGIRKPSIKKSISARTTGRAKREFKKAVIPGYGKKGMGWIHDPKKAMYNKVYNKTTIGVRDIIKDTSNNEDTSPNNKLGFCGTIGAIFQLLGALIMVVVGLIEIVFWGAVVVFFIYIIFKLIF